MNKSFQLLLSVMTCLATMALMVASTSCSDSSSNEGLVINELMVSNHSGIVDEDGEPSDWLEIKNTSSEPVSLGGYALRMVKDKDASKSKKKDKKKTKKNKDKADEAGNADAAVDKKLWAFPERVLGPGECLLVFASKKNISSPDGPLHTSFKLSSKGGKLLLLKRESVVDSVSYPELQDDQCYRRMADSTSTFEACYEPTPGFENTAAGFEQYNALIDKQRKGPLRMWELQPRGHKEGLAWVEVKNVSDQPVDLADYCLTTSIKDMSQWQFPSVQLKPGAVYVVDTRRMQFKVNLNKSVTLTRDGEFVDGLCGAMVPVGASVGRIAGKPGNYYFASPTRGAENTQPGYRHIAAQPSFNPTPGVYAHTDRMRILIDTHGGTVHYTIDGSKPTVQSPVYKDSIVIDRNTTVRAINAGDSTSLLSDEVTATFILAEHTLPVVNITVNPADLYDYYRGIYVTGPHAQAEIPHYGANYWNPSWRKARVELLDGDKGFSAGCELAIFGGFSRMLQKKSFKIRFRDSNGPVGIDYDLYADGQPWDVRKFVLRSGSQDITGVMARDEFFTSLMAESCPNLLVQAYRPVVLYVNAAYFGVYYIRDKIDKRFVARHLNVSDDEVSIIMSGKYCEEGTKKDFDDLVAYIKSHDMSVGEHYAAVKDRIDVTGLVDLQLGQMYSGNQDLGNVRFVRSEDPAGDMKWHLVFYDLDATWASDKTPADYIYNASGGVAVQNTLTRLLLKNDEFRQLLLQRTSLHLHKTFAPSHARAVFDRLIATIRPEMKRNCERWPRVLSYGGWEKHVEAFRKQFDGRPKFLLDGLRKALNITPDEEKKYFADLGY